MPDSIIWHIEWRSSNTPRGVLEIEAKDLAGALSAFFTQHDYRLIDWFTVRKEVGD